MPALDFSVRRRAGRGVDVVDIHGHCLRSFLDLPLRSKGASFAGSLSLQCGALAHQGVAFLFKLATPPPELVALFFKLVVLVFELVTFIADLEILLGELEQPGTECESADRGARRVMIDTSLTVVLFLGYAPIRTRVAMSLSFPGLKSGTRLRIRSILM